MKPNLFSLRSDYNLSYSCLTEGKRLDLLVLGAAKSCIHMAISHHILTVHLKYEDNNAD